MRTSDRPSSASAGGGPGGVPPRAAGGGGDLGRGERRARRGFGGRCFYHQMPPRAGGGPEDFQRRPPGFDAYWDRTELSSRLTSGECLFNDRIAVTRTSSSR